MAYFKRATKKEKENRRQKALETAKSWLTNGHSLEAIAQGIWNHYGYPVTVKGNVLSCGDMTGNIFWTLER